MTPASLLDIEQIRQALSEAASPEADLTKRAVYVATARALVDRLCAQLSQLDKHVQALEGEIGRASRDVTSLSLAEREGP